MSEFHYLSQGKDKLWADLQLAPTTSNPAILAYTRSMQSERETSLTGLGVEDHSRAASDTVAVVNIKN